MPIQGAERFGAVVDGRYNRKSRFPQKDGQPGRGILVVIGHYNPNAAELGGLDHAAIAQQPACRATATAARIG